MKIPVIWICAESRNFESFNLQANNDWVKLNTNQWHCLPLVWKEAAITFQRAWELDGTQYHVRVIESQLEGVPENACTRSA